MRRVVKGYLFAATEGGVETGRGLGNRIDKGGAASERSNGRKL